MKGLGGFIIRGLEGCIRELADNCLVLRTHMNMVVGKSRVGSSFGWLSVVYTCWMSFLTTTTFPFGRRHKFQGFK